MLQEYNEMPLSMMKAMGRRNKTAASEVKKWILEALGRAGVTELSVCPGDMEIGFQLGIENEENGSIPVRYSLNILGGDGKVRLVQEACTVEKKGAENVLKWFICRRNMELSGKGMNAVYERDDDKIILSEVIKVRDRTCRQLIGEISRMNRVAEADYDLLKCLKKGIVTKDIAVQIENEYAKYKEEWKEYVGI